MNIMDQLGQMLLPKAVEPLPCMLPQLPPQPARVPAGKVTPILRTQFADVTHASQLGPLVMSSDVTESDIDRIVAESLTAQAGQDDLVEEGGRLIGLRVSETRSTQPGLPQLQVPPV